MRRSSKDKLNALHLGGGIGIAAIIAAFTQSVAAFVVVAVALIAASLLTGEIRLPKRSGGKSRE